MNEIVSELFEKSGGYFGFRYEFDYPRYEITNIDKFIKKLLKEIKYVHFYDLTDAQIKHVRKQINKHFLE